MIRLLWVDRKATVIQIITSYNQGMQNNISECTKQTGYSSYSICVKPAGTGNGKLRLLFTQACIGQYKAGKTSNGRLRTCESMDSPCLLSVDQAASCGVMMWGFF